MNLPYLLAQALPASTSEMMRPDGLEVTIIVVVVFALGYFIGHRRGRRR